MAEPWPFAPLSPVVETLEWLTDILPARDAEQRLALRARPRVTLALAHRLDRQGYADMTAVLRAGAAGEWSVPLYPRADGAATVAERAGVLTGPVAFSRERQGRTIARAEFLLRPEPQGETAASDLPLYRERPVLTDPTIARRPLAQSLVRAVEPVDSGLGPVVLETTRGFVEERHAIALVEHGPPPRARLRRMLRSFSGRLRAFWLPSWGGELAPLDPVTAGAITLRVAAQGAAADHVGRDLMVDAASPTFARVTAASADGAAHVLTLDAALPALAAGAPVHRLLSMRLDSDRVELAHTAAQTEFQVAAVEVPA